MSRSDHPDRIHGVVFRDAHPRSFHPVDSCSFSRGVTAVAITTDQTDRDRSGQANGGVPTTISPDSRAITWITPTNLPPCQTDDAGWRCTRPDTLEVRGDGTRPGRPGFRRGWAEGARGEGRRMCKVARVRSPALERGHAPLGDPSGGQVPPRPSIDRLAKPRELALRLIGLDVGPPRAFDPVPHLRHPPVAPRA